MALGDRLRGLAGRMGSRLITFSQPAVERVEGVGIPPMPPPAVDAGALALVRSRGALEGTITDGAGPMHTRTSTYPGDGLDPVAVDTIFREADRGQWISRYADLYHQVRRRSTHIFAVDHIRRVGVSGKKFLVHAHDSTPLAQGLRQYMEACVDEIDGFDTATYELLGANGPGYGAQEIVWGWRRVRFPWQGRTVSMDGLLPVGLRWVHQKHFWFAWDSDAPFIDLGGGAGKVPLSALPHKFVWHTTLGEGFASSRGWLRPVTWIHLLAQGAFRDAGILLRLFGIPNIQARIPRNLWENETIKAAVAAGLADFGNAKPSLFPDEVKIESSPGTAASGAADLHPRMIGIANAEISKAMLFQTLTTESSASGAGSYAQSRVHENQKYDAVAADAVGVCENQRRDLGRSIVTLNLSDLCRIFGAGPDDILAHLPWFSRRVERETTPKERAETASIFMRNGLALSKSQFRDEYAFDVPTGSDDEMNGEPVQVSRGAAAVSSVAAVEGVKVSENPSPDRAASVEERGDGIDSTTNARI